jgi:CheY-like chemotaxis protein
VAEDNRTNRLVLRWMLEGAGPRIAFAGNGREALELSVRLAPDLILMDVSMPEMDGLEATRQIRLREREAGAPAVPIVALTANAMAGDRKRCIDAGMDDYLAKPVRKGQLLDLLERHGLRARTEPAAPG